MTFEVDEFIAKVRESDLSVESKATLLVEHFGISFVEAFRMLEEK